MSSSHTDPFRILFVCLGNICRSPLAEGVFRNLVREGGLEGIYEIDSAGTGAWHVGESPDPRSADVALRNGIELSGEGRQVDASDLRRFDLLVAMDERNLSDLETLRAGIEAPQGEPDGVELRRLREFDPEAGAELDVPDPYYGGPGGFDRVYEMVDRSCRGLLDELESRRRSG